MVKDTKRYETFKYLSYFVGKAFIISVICFFLMILLCVVLYFGDMFIRMNNGDYDRPLFNGYVIVSGSMIPTININDAVLIRRIDDDSYQVGDIITFISSDSNYRGLSITHRIINKKEVNASSSIYTTKGDNNQVADREGVKTSQIYGKVMFIIPKIGYLSSFLSKPLNFFLCILIPIGVVIIYDVAKIGFVMNKHKRISS